MATLLQIFTSFEDIEDALWYILKWSPGCFKYVSTWDVIEFWRLEDSSNWKPARRIWRTWSLQVRQAFKLKASYVQTLRNFLFQKLSRPAWWRSWADQSERRTEVQFEGFLLTKYHHIYYLSFRGWHLVSILSIFYFSLLICSNIRLRLILFEPDYLVSCVVLQYWKSITVIFAKRSISKINKMSTLRISSI